MKKFLSLVLALVMTMSLVTIGAGAKVFTDDSKINYQEAVDVMSAIKIIDGNADGSFRPANTLTRGAASKIICNLILGPTTASALGADTAPFKDVPANSMYAGYVAYCSQQGVINGYADGTFRPAGTVTGYQFMKMLLVALGYDGASEKFTGPNWSVNVAKLAISIGLNEGNEKFDGSVAMTREEACLYAFNTLCTTMVEYDSKSTVTVNGVTIATGIAKAKEVGNSVLSNNTIYKDGKMQFAEKYFSDLKLQFNSDDFGRPAQTWKVKAEKVGTYTWLANATYTKKTEIGDIYSDLGLSEKVLAKNIDVYVDGELVSNAVNLSKGDSANKFGDNGVLTEVFYDDDDNTATITMINTYVGEISKTTAATKAKDAYVTVDSYNRPTGVSTKLDFTTTEEFKDEAVVLFTYSLSAKSIMSVVAAESVEGTATKVVTGLQEGNTVLASIDVGGTTYKASAKVACDSASAKNDYTVYLDGYGYAIYVEEQSVVSSDYALMVEAKGFNDFSGQKAKVIFADGTVKVVDTAKDYAAVGSNNIPSNTIVTYKVDDAKVYTLKAVTTNGGTKKDDASATFKMEKGKAQITIQTNIPNAVVYGNSKSVFVVEDGHSAYKSYTGIAAAPSVSGDITSAYYFCKTGSMVTVMFLVPGSASVTNDTKDMLYLAGASVSKLNHTGDSDYYEYNAVVNGEVKTVMVDSNVTVDGHAANALGNSVYSKATYDKYGVIDGLTKYSVSSGDSKYSAAGTGTDKKSGAYTVILNNIAYSVSDTAKFYEIDVKGNIVSGTINSVSKDANDTYVVIFVDGQVAYLFLQTKNDDPIITPEPSTTDVQVVNSDKGNSYTTPTFYVADSRALTKAEMKTALVGKMKADGCTAISFADSEMTYTNAEGIVNTTTLTLDTKSQVYKLTIDGTSVSYFNAVEASKTDLRKTTLSGAGTGFIYDLDADGVYEYLAYPSGTETDLKCKHDIEITTGYVAFGLTGTPTDAFASAGGAVTYAKINSTVTVVFTAKNDIVLTGSTAANVTSSIETKSLTYSGNQEKLADTSTKTVLTFKTDADLKILKGETITAVYAIAEADVTGVTLKYTAKA